MIIYFDNTNLNIPVNDNSYRYRAIKGEHSLTLYYSLPEHVEIPIGATCVFEGETYTLENPENFKKHNTRNFEYTLTMESAQSRLKKYKFKDTATRKLKFSLTAKPDLHLQMLADNLNRRESGWTAGNCVDAVEKAISYNHAFCSDALSQIAEAFETEWEIVGKTINLRKVEYNKDNPLPLSYGRGNGFKSGIGRSNSNNSKPVEILFVQGGERNIDASKYGNPELLLPENQTIGYDGQYFSTQEGFNAANARLYVVDGDGFSIRRSDKDLSSQAEDSLDCSHIYPSYVGTISEVKVVDAENHFYDFIDNSIPENLDFSQYRIDGETVTVIFQDGMLTGKEFEIEQTDKALTGYVHSERRFKPVPQEVDGQTMPNDIFTPVAGGKYAVFGMTMPDAYIRDDETKTGASWDMFREAVKYMYENEEQKFTFTGELDGIWAKKDWLNIGGKIKPGGYVLFTDNRFQPEGALIRIVGIKDYINNPHSPTIELSNEIVGNSISSNLRKIETNEVVVDNLHNNAVQFTKRRFRDSQETIGMLRESLLNFSEGINPISVQTMMMLVGDESLQFRFVNNTANPLSVPHGVEFSPETKILTSDSGIIQHMTIGIKTLSSNHAVNEYKFWNISEFNSPPLTDPKKKYYLYAKVSKTNSTGEFRLSETAVKLEQEAGYYNLLVGILNSEYESDRSYINLHGFTEVLPGRITTDKIVSSDGLNFLDFLNNAFRVGNNNASLEFNKQGDGQLILKGTLIQSPAGETTQPIGYYRGEYNPNYTYYEGDIVSYGGSTYRFIYPTPQTGKNPTNTAYWAVYAAKGEDGEPGAKGEDGSNGEPSDWKTFAYKKSASKPNTPTDTSPIPDNWQDYPDSEAEEGDKWWMTVAIVHWTGNEWLAGAYINNTFTPGQWSNPIPVTGEQGTDGQYVDFKFYATSNMNAPGWNNTLASMLNPTGWLDQLPQLPPYGAIWMIEAYKQAGGTQLITTWSDPARISGEKGQDGTDGQDGQDGLDGTDGKDGTDIEFIYARTTDPEEEPQTPETEQQDDYVPEGWTDTPQGVTSTYICELVSVRSKQNGIWGEFSHPAVWSKWGEKGKDGDGYEYIYRRTETENMPVPPASKPKPDDEWTDEPQGVTAALPYEWVSTRKQENSVWSAFSRPVIWARYAKDGTNGSYTSFVFKLSETPPDAPAGTNPIPSGWSDSPASSYNVSNISHDSVWTLQADGTRKSPAIGNNGFTKNRISFATSQPNQEITIYLKVSSETNYDFALVGQADNPNLSRTANYTDRISGETEKEISVNIPGAGEHYIEIGYGKDGSANGRQDCAWYSVNSGPIWWMSKATVSYQNGQWQAGVWSDPVKVTAEDGNNGVDGKFWDYKYITDSSAPETPQGLNPSGWFDQPPAINAEYGDYLWMSYCEKDAGQTQILWGWSTPVRISGEDGKNGKDGTNGTNGTNGKDGTAGAYYERRFATSGSPTQWPDYPRIPFGSPPSGWTLEVPVVSPLQYLWVIEAKIQPSEKAGAIPSWSTPARITGEKGEKGDKGDAGNTGPAMVFRGEYSSAETYYGTLYRVDAVRVTQSNGSFLYYVTRSDAGTISGTDPADGSKWNPFESQLQSVATNLLLAEMANIAGWIFKNQRLESQDGRMFLDGNGNGNIIAENEKGYKLKIGTNIDGLNNSGLILENDTGETIGSLLFISYSPEILISSLYFLHKNLNIDMKLTAADGLSFGRRNKSGGLIANSNIGYSGIYFNGNSNYNTFQLQTESTNMILMMNGLPTSSSGLSKGQVWRDVNTLKIV
jgi:hypothetical protein